MTTEKQKLGDWGENLIRKKFNCPGCKREKTLRKLPPNFKCADIICDFCVSPEIDTFIDLAWVVHIVIKKK